MVPRQIVIVPVVVLLAVGFIMFFVVANEICERKSVVGGNKVDAGVGPSAIVVVKVRATGQSIRHFADSAFVAFPKTTDGIAIFAVPFRPQHRKIADLISDFACDSTGSW